MFFNMKGVKNGNGKERLYGFTIATITPLFGGFPWFQRKDIGLFVKYNNEFDEIEFKVVTGDIESIKKEYYKQGYVKIDWGFYRLKSGEAIPSDKETWYVYWNNKLKYSLKHRLGLRTETREELVRLVDIKPIEIKIKIVSHSWQGKPVWCEILHGKFEGVLSIVAEKDLAELVKERREVVELSPQVLTNFDELIKALTGKVGILGKNIYYLDHFGGKKNQGYGLCLVSISPL